MSGRVSWIEHKGAKILYIAVLIRRDLYWAKSLEEAKEWLAEQARK